MIDFARAYQSHQQAIRSVIESSSKVEEVIVRMNN